MKIKILMLIAVLMSSSIGVVMGAEKPEAGAFERAVCKKMESMFAYNKGSIDQHELNVFLKDNGIASTGQLIAILEQGKELLNQDIVAEKTSNRSLVPYWTGLFSAFASSIGGALGFFNESSKFFTAEEELWRYDYNLKNTQRNLEAMQPYFVDGKPGWDAIKRAMLQGDDYHLRHAILNLAATDNSWNTPTHNVYYTTEAERNFSRIDRYIDNGQFSAQKYQELKPRPAEYIQKNVILYKSLIAVGLLAMPVIAYKLYGYYTFERNKKKEIMTLDAIIEQVKAVQ